MRTPGSSKVVSSTEVKSLQTFFRLKYGDDSHRNDVKSSIGERELLDHYIRNLRVRTSTARYRRVSRKSPAKVIRQRGPNPGYTFKDRKANSGRDVIL